MRRSSFFDSALFDVLLFAALLAALIGGSWFVAEGYYKQSQYEKETLPDITITREYIPETLGVSFTNRFEFAYIYEDGSVKALKVSPRIVDVVKDAERAGTVEIVGKNRGEGRVSDIQKVALYIDPDDSTTLENLNLEAGE